MDDLSEKTQLRVRVIAVAATVVLAVLLARLWMLQAVLGSEYKLMAEENRTREVSVDAQRGLILDRRGEPIVKNKTSIAVVIDPEKIDDTPGLRRLAKTLDMSVSLIKERMASERDDPLKPRVIKRDVRAETIAYIEENQGDFPGVDLKVESIRDYVKGSLAAHVIGYLGELSSEERKDPDYAHYELGDLVGKSGVERVYEGVLSGTKGTEFVEVNAAGQSMRTVGSSNPDPGNDIVLTIDRRIQESAERALESMIKETQKTKFKNAKAGAIVVMEPRGEILALASYPSYNPEVFTGGISNDQWAYLNDEKNEFPLNNRTIMSAYPPGSTFKVVTSVAGFKTEVMNTGTTVFCSGLWTGLGERWAKRCWERSGHGLNAIVGALEVSCDVFFYDIGYRLDRLGREDLQTWSRNLGFGARTGIDLTSEVEGRVPTAAWKKEWNKNYPEYQTWFPGDTVNMAIGQGDMLATPLQVASVYAGIVTGGEIYRPHVVKSVVGLNGRAIKEIEPEVIKKFELSDEQMGAIRTGLRRVVTDGTARAAFSGFSTPVSGKTGTSEVKGKDDFAFFVAYAPSDDPKYIVSVVIEQGGHGGSAAAPAARKVFEDVFSPPISQDESRTGAGDD